MHVKHEIRLNFVSNLCKAFDSITHHNVFKPFEIQLNSNGNVFYCSLCTWKRIILSDVLSETSEGWKALAIIFGQIVLNTRCLDKRKQIETHFHLPFENRSTWFLFIAPKMKNKIKCQTNK